MPARQQFSLGHMTLYLSLVIFAAISLRGASRAMEIMFSTIEWPVVAPVWTTGRLWLLRLGYYKLMRVKEKADDWIWIIDHSIQTGIEKCLLILGLRESSIKSENFTLTREDIEPIALFPVTKSNGEIVYQQLETVAAKTGIPKQIVSDHGSDLKAGIEAFCNIHKSTVHIYDIKHKTALVLEHELDKNEEWKTFCKLAFQTKQKIKQTQYSFLAPPNQRTKSRYMNIEIIVKWGKDALNYLDNNINDASIIEKLGWLKEYRFKLESWDEVFKVTTITEKLIRKNGLYRACHKDLEKKLLPVVDSIQAKNVMQTLLSFIKVESLKAKAGEHLIASSEIIESIFGNLKYLEKTQSKGGFTTLLLGIAAFVSKTTPEIIKTALESTPTKKVIEWFRENIGKSVQAKKKEISNQNKEQKSYQSLEAA